MLDRRGYCSGLLIDTLRMRTMVPDQLVEHDMRVSESTNWVCKGL